MKTIKLLGGPRDQQEIEVPLQCQRFHHTEHNDDGDVFYVSAPYRYAWWIGHTRVTVAVKRWIPEGHAPSAYEEDVLADVCLLIFASVLIKSILSS